MVAQVPGVTPGSPCAHGVAGTPHGEVHDTKSFVILCYTMKKWTENMIKIVVHELYKLVSKNNVFVDGNVHKAN